MKENPWYNGSNGQREWIDKWNQEYAVCIKCPKYPNCNAIDRTDENTCGLLTLPILNK